MMFRRVICVTLLLLSAGCSLPPPPVVQEIDLITPWRLEDFQWSSAKGDGVISGQAFLKTRGGEVRTCAGSPVILVPLNDYTREMGNIIANGGRPRRIPAYMTYRRETLCDVQGGFELSGLPDGSWRVTAIVNWEVLGEQQGGYLFKDVEIKNGGAVKVIMVEQDILRR